MKPISIAPLVVSLIALAVAITAMLLSTSDRNRDDGRIVTIGSISSYEIEKPVLFDRDDFFVVRHPDFNGAADAIPQFDALYAVEPHIYFGIEKGCRVKWEPDTSFDANDKTYLGIFEGPCSGSKWTVDGVRLFGPGRDLDRFLAVNAPGSADAMIDTRILICANNASPCSKTLADR